MELDESRRTSAPVPAAEEDEAVQLDLMTLLVDFYRGFRKFWWLAALLVAVGSALTLFQSVRVYQPQYRAEASFTIATRITTSYGSDDYTSNYNYGIVTQMARTFPYILGSDILQQIIREDLGVSALNGSISARGLEDTNIFILSVTGPDPVDAHSILLSAIENYPRVAEFIIGDTQLNMLAEPGVSELPVNRFSYPRTLLRGALIGLAAGLALLALYALLRRTIRKADDIQTSLNQKSLGVLPHVVFKRRSGQKTQPVNILSKRVTPAFKESIRGLRSRVIKAMQEQGAKTLMVTSTLPGEGKSTVALNLALSMAQKGARVALVDADLRHQDIHALLGLKEPPVTLSQVMRGEAFPEQARFELFIKGFHFVPCGENREQSVETLRSPAFLQALEALKADMDYVVIDTPPCGMLSDASALAGVSDCLLYVIRQDTAHVSRVIDGLQSLSYTGINMLGCVLNDASAGFTGYGYGYGYGYGGRYAYGYGSRYSYGRYGTYGEEGDQGAGGEKGPEQS